MKIFTVIAFVCYLFVATNSFPTTQEATSPRPLSELAVKCSNNNHVPLDRARVLLSNHFAQASNQNEKCLAHCYLDGKGYFVNEKVDFDKLLENHKKYLPVSQHDELTKSFKACETKMDYNQDKCEVAYQAYQCAEGAKS
uniref:Putative pbp/gobp family n=1 Tax=Panstrongylus lignarius TaxID=156445 RepID=A0A224Y0E7_9HEMI